ncbi:MAG: hypothetical protein Q8S39_16115 [Ignavibacteria bacterium]|nr:hypothetical protein [Ignavibacteria bacterium]
MIYKVSFEFASLPLRRAKRGESFAKTTVAIFQMFLDDIIGLEGFTNIMNDRKLEKGAMILETPKGKEQLEDLENVKTLLGLVK